MAETGPAALGAAAAAESRWPLAVAGGAAVTEFPSARWAGGNWSAGEAGDIVGAHYGPSGPAGVLYEQFGITAERVGAAAQASLSKLGATSGDTTGS